MTSAFGLALYGSIQRKVINCDFRGVALGDSWISPVDSVLTWAPYLYALSLLDKKDFDLVDHSAQATAVAISEGHFTKATQLWGITEDIIAKTTDNVDVYNILRHNSPPFPKFKSLGSAELDKLYTQHVGHLYSDPLTELMNGPIKQKLGVIPKNVTWGGQSGEVFAYQSEDFMKPVIDDVSKLLHYGLKVVVFQGQLDMICDTMGAEKWMAKLNWSGLSQFLNSSRKAIYPPSAAKSKNTGAFYKGFKNLELYYILKAGHMVPTDNGEMALEMVKRVIGETAY